MTLEFSAETLAKFREIVARYQKGGDVAVLYRQQEFGHWGKKL
jgi:hypothetical protein